MNADTCVFSTARTPQREALFKWVGPLAVNNFVVFGRLDSAEHPRSLSDISSKKIGTKADDASSEYLSS